MDGTVSMARHSREWPKGQRDMWHVQQCPWTQLRALGAAGGQGGSVPAVSPLLVTRTPLCPALCSHIYFAGYLKPAPSTCRGRGPSGDEPGDISQLGWEDS